MINLTDEVRKIAGAIERNDLEEAKRLVDHLNKYLSERERKEHGEPSSAAGQSAGPCAKQKL